MALQIISLKIIPSMATKLACFVLLLCFSLVSPTFSSVFTDGIDHWCDKTPNPQPCKYFMRQKGKIYVPKHKSEFRRMSVQIALESAIDAQNHNKWHGKKCRNHKEKAAWADCLKLYEETILHLNRTLVTKCDDIDVQTWLSTGLTNLETCRTSFEELGVSDSMLLHMISNDVSKLISNTLALNNNNASFLPQTYRQGFPGWLKTGDRKLLQSSPLTPDLVVAQDGSGNHRTIKEALEAAAKRSGSGRFVIHVKRGVYKENLEIGSNLKNIMLVGDGMRYTIITGSRSVGGGSTTFSSATVAVIGKGFIAHGITFRNTAGPQNYQAVALTSASDHSVFYRCGFEGYQDTLFVHSQRQFYKECYIYGTVDFIFGNAAVVFQNCMIYVRRPMDKQKNTITAQGRIDPNQNTGISIHNSRVMAANDLVPVLGSFKTFLGRPWKEYSRTIFMQSYLDSLVDPTGWLERDGNFALDTLYYGEYKNIGPASSTTRRVKWKGYRVITSSAEASKFTAANFIAGTSWLLNAGVPFTSGL